MITEDSTATSSDTAIHDRLMAQAEAADRGEGETPLEILPSAKQGSDEAAQGNETRADDSTGSEKPDSPESSADKVDTQKTEQQEQARDESGKFVKKAETPEGEQAASEATKPEAQANANAKPESSYTKAQKEEARQAKAWKQIESDKAAVRQREQQLGRLEQDVNQLKRKLAGDVGAQARFDSKQYAKAAGDFERSAAALMRDGDTEKAQEQLNLAQKCRVAAGQAQQAEYGEAQQQFEATWRQSAEVVIKENPALGDPNTEEAQAMMQLLESEPILAHIPDGFAKGVQILKNQREAAEASGLRDENAKLKSEVARLNSKLSPLSGKSSAGHSTVDTGFASWSTERQREHLQRQAELADQ